MARVSNAYLLTILLILLLVLFRLVNGCLRCSLLCLLAFLSLLNVYCQIGNFHDSPLCNCHALQMVNFTEVNESIRILFVYEVLAITQRVFEVLIVVTVVEIETELIIAEFLSVLIVDESELEEAESHAIVVLLVMYILNITHFI